MQLAVTASFPAGSASWPAWLQDSSSPDETHSAGTKERERSSHSTDVTSNFMRSRDYFMVNFVMIVLVGLQ